MAKKRRIRNFFARTYNFKQWLGYGHVKNGATLVSSMASSLLHDIKPTKSIDESFEQAVNRLGLTEKDLISRQQGYFRNFWLMLLLALLLAIYCVYNFYIFNFYAGFISMFMMLAAFSTSIFMHFWYFQIKKRKLGCTIKEWLTGKEEQ